MRTKQQLREYDRLYKITFRKNHPDYIKNQNLKSGYGITLDDFNRLRINQLNRCAICKQESQALCVDHDHKTNKVRALLCRNCNSMIGLGHDKPSVLVWAAAYILEHRNKLVDNDNAK